MELALGQADLVGEPAHRRRDPGVVRGPGPPAASPGRAGRRRRAPATAPGQDQLGPFGRRDRLGQRVRGAADPTRRRARAARRAGRRAARRTRRAPLRGGTGRRRSSSRAPSASGWARVSGPATTRRERPVVGDPHQVGAAVGHDRRGRGWPDATHPHARQVRRQGGRRRQLEVVGLGGRRRCGGVRHRGVPCGAGLVCQGRGDGAGRRRHDGGQRTRERCVTSRRMADSRCTDVRRSTRNV